MDIVFLFFQVSIVPGVVSLYVSLFVAWSCVLVYSFAGIISIDSHCFAELVSGIRVLAIDLRRLSWRVAGLS